MAENSGGGCAQGQHNEQGTGWLPTGERRGGAGMDCSTTSSHPHNMRQATQYQALGSTFRREVTESRCPCTKYDWSLSCFATSLADEPDTSIQVLEKRAHAVSMKAVYTNACSGSEATSSRECGGER